MPAPKSIEFSLGAPRGPIRPKYELFRWVGEPGWPRRFQESWAIGDVGTGKTAALIDSIFFSVYYYPGARVAVVRSTLVELQSALIPDLKARLAPMFESGFLQYLRDLDIIKVHNGAEIHFFGLDTAQDKLVGQQWFRAFVDQGERVRPEMLDLLHTRVRQQVRHKDTKELGTTFIKITANWDRGRDWVWKRVVQGAQSLDANGDILEKVVRQQVYGRTFESRILAIFSRTIENEELTEDYFRHLVLSGKMASRFLRGGYEGKDEHLIFPEYSHKHITDLEPDLDGRPVYVGLDHGLRHPTVALFFVRDGLGRLIGVKEYIKRNASAMENAEALADILFSMTAAGASRFHIYADPSMWARNAMDADLSSVASVYQDVLNKYDLPATFSPAYVRKRDRNPTGRTSVATPVEFGISVIKDLLREGKLLINPRLTPKLDQTLGEITHEDVEKDAMTLVDVFDAARYALTNIRVYDEEDDYEELERPEVGIPVVNIDRRRYGP